MQKVILWLVVAAFNLPASAQGTVKLKSGANMVSKNGAFMVIKNMNLENEGTIQQSTGDGTIKFTGSNDVTLGGNGTTLDNLVLAKDGISKVTLSGNIEVKSQIHFMGGMLNLDNYLADLGSTGQLVNESESSRAFTTGTGYLEATGDLSDASSTNLGTLGVYIKPDKNMDNVIIRRGHQLQPGLPNSIERYFDIIPEKKKMMKAVIRFTYFDNELNGVNESLLNLFAIDKKATWELVGHDSRNDIANYVEQKNMDKFVRISLAESVTVPKKDKKAAEDMLLTSTLIVNAFPNPFNDYFTLQINSASNAPVSVRIFSASGSVMEEKRNVAPKGTLRVGGAKYVPGMYFAEVIQNDEKVVLKLIKQGY